MLYTKMHGLGNDFILCYDAEGHDKDYQALTVALCDRHTGIGADGLIVATPSKVADICMRIINADGSEAEMCGNGIRCFADYVYRRGYVKEKSFTVETLAGIMKPVITEQTEHGAQVTVDMGKPIFPAREIPMDLDADKVLDHIIEVEGTKLPVSVVLMGVPHAVVFVDNTEDIPFTTWGPTLEKHDIFPKNTNVNFVERLGDHHIRVRTWERGAGATLACGTGCCATTVVCYEKGLANGPVRVELALGDMHIEYRKDGDGHVYMTGPAVQVFETEIP